MKIARRLLDCMKIERLNKVSKNDIRVECYGVIDECMSNLGAAKSILNNQNSIEIEKRIANVESQGKSN